MLRSGWIIETKGRSLVLLRGKVRIYKQNTLDAKIIITMVEGPGCKIKGEKIRAKLLRQKVIIVRGNAVDQEKKASKKKNSDEKDVALTSFHRLTGQILEEVRTLGKEMFMFFGSACLRVHFLMAGVFRVNGEDLDRDRGKLGAAPSLEIQFCKDCLSFYKCAVEIRPSSACNQKYELLKELDICSPSFNLKRAVMEFMREPERQLCDVLLDQDILPGVGNIIKNEALFDSGLKPDSKVKDLSEEHISHLIKMTRDFSMVFYKCRSTGTNLRNHLKVYQKAKCCECQTNITMTRMGEDSGRVTFFCPECQTNDINKKRKLKLPYKSTLLGWVQEGSTADTCEWACSTCTLLNPGRQSNCSACLEPRTGPSIATSNQRLTSLRTGEKLITEPMLKKRRLEESYCPEAGTETALKPEQNTDEGLGFSPFTSSFRDGSKLNPDVVGTDKEVCGSKIPICPGHARKCCMRQSFIDNENKGRWFFTCNATPASKQCKYFKWADEHFPVCSGHGKLCALKRVLKQGPNNRRQFFCCPLKKSSCRYFEWAVGYD